MSNVPGMSLGDIKRATKQPTPYEDLQQIVKQQQSLIATAVNVASVAHTMGLPAEHPVTNMCHVLTGDLVNFKGRLDSLVVTITPDIKPHKALPIGSQLLTLQEDMERVMLPIIRDIQSQVN